MRTSPDHTNEIKHVLSLFPTDAPLRILEIGSWTGGSAIPWAKYSPAESLVTCLDPWTPYLGAQDTTPVHYEMTKALETDSVHKTFLAKVVEAGVSPKVAVIRASSRVMLPRFGPESFDIIYVDGSHRYEDVLFDLTHAQRIVKRPGVICGDDYDRNGRKFAETLWEARNLDYSIPLRCHPGVILAVEEAFPAVKCLVRGFWYVHS